MTETGQNHQKQKKKDTHSNKVQGIFLQFWKFLTLIRLSNPIRTTPR